MPAIESEPDGDGVAVDDDAEDEDEERVRLLFDPAAEQPAAASTAQTATADVPARSARSDLDTKAAPWAGSRRVIDGSP
jgi:hypothetical protein